MIWGSYNKNDIKYFKMSETYKTVLQEVFGFSSLRPFQKNVFEAMINEKDVFVISPTGSGKSLCFQLPALLQEGICIVLSPLRSLIFDQVEALKKKGIKAELLNGDLPKTKKNKLFQELEKNYPSIKLLYSTPESIMCNEETKVIFQDLFQRGLLNRIVLDEAHCISTWGHEFRPNYLKVKNIKNVFPDIPIAAFTATATEKVNADIQDILQLDENTEVFESSFIRHNLNIVIRSRGSKKNEIQECLDEIVEELEGKYQNQSAILYAFSRNKCEELSNLLLEYGIKSDFYHAGLSAKKRNEIQMKWLDGELQIICATIAFGMGIDKPDVRVVYHFNLPKTIEGYYQEIGRGGRDGERSDCIFYYNENDPIVYKQMTDKKSKQIRATENVFREKKLEMAKNEMQKMYDMIGFIENQTDCRHILLANYFGEKRKEKIGFCGDLCDSCVHFNQMKEKGQKVKKQNVTSECQEIINHINSTREPYRETIIRKMIGYPKKIPKRKLKKEVSGDWNAYKASYEIEREKFVRHNQEYNAKEKKVKRVLVKLVVDKYLKIEIVKVGKGIYGSWKEKYLVYKKAKKILDGEKKIRI